MSTETWAAHFDLMWAALAEIGWCDTPGGSEYRRVLTEAIDADSPVGDELARFIHRRTNE